VWGNFTLTWHITLRRAPSARIAYAAATAAAAAAAAAAAENSLQL